MLSKEVTLATLNASSDGILREGERKKDWRSIMIGKDDAPRAASTESNATGVSESRRERQAPPQRRVVIEFGPTVVPRLDEIRRMSDAKTNADLVSDALRLFDWFLHQRAEGWRLQLVRDDIVREVEVSFR
jgi:hypothetical protein